MPQYWDLMQLLGDVENMLRKGKRKIVIEDKEQYWEVH